MSAPSRGSTGLATPSLRRRTTLVVLGLLAAMLLAVAILTDVVLGQRLEGQLEARLLDRAEVAEALVDQVGPQDLARRLEGDGVSVSVRTSDGAVYTQGSLAAAVDGSGGDQPSPPGAGPAPGPAGGPAGGPNPPGQDEVVRSGDLLTVDRTLDDDTEVTLLADATDVRRTLSQVRLALLVAALLVLLVAAALTPLVVGRSLRPLDRITEVARSITRGDRGRRLDPRQPGSELGRTAVAFDEMLDEVVGAEQQARASEQRLRDFLSDAAHDLRTPLAGVQATAEQILREDPDRSIREAALTGLVRETRRASRMVDDMLTMARIERGLDLDPAEVDLETLVREQVDTLRRTHPSLDLEATGSAAVVLGDRDRLSQVMTNLVDNAAHATRGRGRVEVRMRVEGDDVVVEVVDDGPGVPPAERERIFERLVRLDRARTTRHAGAGLGLPIARGIARAHGGDLTCVAGPDVGATFRLVVPRGMAAPGADT